VLCYYIERNSEKDIWLETLSKPSKNHFQETLAQQTHITNT